MSSSPSNTVSTTHRVNDLSNIVTTLSDSITQAMRYLYEVQTATINAGRIRHQSEKFTTIKRALKDQWEVVASVLKRCNSFAGDVDILYGAIGKTNKKDISDFLKKMYDQCHKIEQIAQDLANGHKGVEEKYLQYKIEIETQLTRRRRRGHSLPPTEPTSVGDRSAGRTLERSEDVVLINKPPRVAVEAALRENRFSGLYPDGLAAMSSFESALGSIRQELFNLASFISSEVTFCDRCLKGLDKPKEMPSAEELKKYATEWKYRRNDLTQAINDIYFACDALLVDGKGAPAATPPSKTSRRKAPAYTEEEKLQLTLDKASKERENDLPPSEPHKHDKDDAPHFFFCFPFLFAKRKTS